MARKTKEDAEQTRLAILDSALKTFYDKGFARTTFDEIAKRINLTKGAVYWHFRNKADIIAALIEQKADEQSKKYSQNTPETLSELRKAVLIRAETIDNDDEFRKFLFFMNYRMEWSEAVIENVWQKIGELCELSDKKLYNCLLNIQKNGGIRKDIDINKVKETLICLWKGCVNHHIFNYKTKNDIKLSKMVMNGFDIVMSGIKVENK